MADHVCNFIDLGGQKCCTCGAWKPPARIAASDQFDPSRAKPETVRELCVALDAYATENRLFEPVRLLDPTAYSRLCNALEQWRSECRIPLRTQAIVDRELLAAARLYYRTIHGTGVTTGAITKEMHADLTRLALEEPNSGPSSVDVADGDGPLPPSAPVSPAGAALTTDPLQSFDARVWAREFMRLLNDGTFAKNGGVDEGLMIAWFANALMRGFDEHAWRYPSGPPGAAAAKESSDTTAAAPDGAALKGDDDERECNCNQALGLKELFARFVYYNFGGWLTNDTDRVKWSDMRHLPDDVRARVESYHETRVATGKLPDWIKL